MITEEKHLVVALRSGSESAFRQLVDTHQERVLNTCLSFLPNRSDAEDVSQEVFVEVYRSIGKFKGDSKISTWIYRVSVSKCLEELRRRKRKKRAAYFLSLVGLEDQMAKSVEDTFSHPGVQLENVERTKILFENIAKLPEKQRVAFTLCQVDGRSNQEAADIMQASVSSVESLLFRARKNLRKWLGDFYRNDKM